MVANACSNMANVSTYWWNPKRRDLDVSAKQRAGLVTSTRIGQWTHYKRDDALLRRLGEQLATEL
jgi:hypothetical protein